MDIKVKYLSESKDNAPLINSALSKAKEGDRVILPDGSFPINSPLQITKPLRFEGGNTTILTNLNTSALIIQNYSIKPVRVSSIDFFNNSDSGDGIIVNGITHLEYSWVKGFGGNGITVSADVGTTQSNASFSKFQSVLISECKKSGMFFQGGDANQCNCYHIDVRDNGEWGIYDHSFLGNQFFGCMAHGNQKGNYCADDPNNRASFFGCYSEQGNAPDILSGAATWHGGLAANGFILRAWAKIYVNNANQTDSGEIQYT